MSSRTPSLLTTSIILSSNKIQNGDIPVTAYTVLENGQAELHPYSIRPRETVTGSKNTVIDKKVKVEFTVLH